MMQELGRGSDETEFGFQILARLSTIESGRICKLGSFTGLYCIQFIHGLYELLRTT